MSETATAMAVADAPVTSKTTPKKTAKKVPGKPRAHPPVSEMVNAAIGALKDKKGSSLQAIKKYIAGTYKLDVEKQSTFIKKYLKLAVSKKTIVQTKGSGAAGSFKLATKAENEKKVVKTSGAEKKSAGQRIAAKKPVAAMKKPATKKAAVVKKQATKKVVSSSKQSVSKSKLPSKAKKAGKTPATKPKAPKYKFVKQ
ncbi:PREDICTED: histone H1A, sperm-like [Ceratosolen solmsi marchali]|uniref:Histone H1A, sperm-like n=1 Tax=Ceratosolen solmsi marchali TaxID=326594 RepID=A0AAJ7DUS8_9HYME|nr:PREDICTED: histone H1A, sperm-like [Ceratosolen solmsi marchali]